MTKQKKGLQDLSALRDTMVEEKIAPELEESNLLFLEFGGALTEELAHDVLEREEILAQNAYRVEIEKRIKDLRGEMKNCRALEREILDRIEVKELSVYQSSEYLKLRGEITEMSNFVLGGEAGEQEGYWKAKIRSRQQLLKKVAKEVIDSKIAPELDELELIHTEIANIDLTITEQENLLKAGKEK